MTKNFVHTDEKSVKIYTKSEKSRDTQVSNSSKNLQLPHKCSKKSPENFKNKKTLVNIREVSKKF